MPDKRFQYLTREAKWLDVPEQALWDNGNKILDTFTNIYQVREIKNKGGRPKGKNVVKVTTTLSKQAAGILETLKPKGGETISKLLIENFNPNKNEKTN